jgi:hypothetical protein
MKTNGVTLTWKLLTAIGVVFVSGLAARAADNPTALQLVREGDRYVGEQSRDKVVQIRSERSFGNLHPNIWYVVYHDPTATLKVTEVKFGAGKMLEVRRPLRLLEPLMGGDSPLDYEKLKFDSDEAINTALKEPLLESVKVTATQLKLERMGEEAAGVEGHGGPGDAVWKIRLWAKRVGEASRSTDGSTDIGEIWVSATDAKVVKVDVHPGRLS